MHKKKEYLKGKLTDLALPENVRNDFIEWNLGGINSIAEKIQSGLTIKDARLRATKRTVIQTNEIPSTSGENGETITELSREQVAVVPSLKIRRLTGTKDSFEINRERAARIPSNEDTGVLDKI